MRHIGFIVFPGFQVMSCAVMAVFEFANGEMGEPIYDAPLLTETFRSIHSSISESARTAGRDIGFSKMRERRSLSP